MANIKKSFNFRNGVQVDDDNLKVSATGLVGIGTTVPTEALDVRGNLVVSGVSSAATIQAGVLTVTTFNPSSIIGAGISVVSGVVTASSGIVTYHGDGRFLQGLPTSQWEDVNTGFGVSSIYNTGGNVGIATSNPQSTLQIGTNPDIVGNKGVGLSSIGNINASGIISATTFIGNLTGNVTGNISGNITGAAVSAAQLQTARTIGGVSFDGTSNINLPGVNIAGNQNTSGTAANLSGTPNISINNLNVSGTSTFSDDIITGVGATVGIGTTVFFGNGVRLLFGNDDYRISHDGFNSYLDSRKGDLNIRTLGAGAIGGGTGVNVQIISDDEYMARFVRNSSVDLYYDNGLKFQTSGIGVTVYNQIDTTNIVASGVITATTELNSPLIGVGTDAPANDIQVRKSSNAEIQVTSDTGVAGLTVGRESGAGNTNNAEFRYGGGAGAPYSTPQSLDLVNYGTDNFNYYLSANNPGGAVGDFHWHKGLNNTRLMTLTNTGRLGIGETQPDTALHVAGVCTVTSSSFVAANFEVGGNTTIGGNLIVSGSLSLSSALNANLSGNVTGNLSGSVNNTGISTFARVAIGTYYPADGVELDGSLITASFNRVSVGTTEPESGADFKNVGTNVNDRFLILPTVSNGGDISSPVNGGLIFNSSTNSVQLYSSGSWTSLATGGGEANQNAFSSVAVAGQTTVAADSTTDSLTLVAGSNVTITTNAGNDSVTIAASGGGGGGISNVVEDTTPQLGGNLDVQTNEITTSTSNGNIKLNPNGTGVVEVKGDGSSADGTIQLNCSQNSHGIKLKSPPHSASASYTLTFPNSIVNGQFLKTDASGNLSWDSRLGAGFVNAADYGLDASKTDGTNVTAINNAIAALGTNGGTIFFPGGMFYLNAAIELTQAANENSLRFVGSGHQNYGGGSDTGGTVLRRDADDEFFNITNSRAIHFIGITFKGGAANGNGGNSGASGGNGAIYVLANAGCQGYLIENCVFHGIANCISFKGLSDSIIRGCRFRNVPSNKGNGACIKLDENGSEVIDQIRIQDCVIDGSPDGSAINTAIDGIAIYNTVSTVYVTNTSAIRLRRSFFSDANWDGNFFYFQNSESERANEDGFSINGTGNFVTIDNCFACSNGQGSVSGTGHGINIGASQNSSINITNPNVRDNSLHGILIAGPTNNCSIVNPSIGGNSRGSSGTSHGIVIGTNANNVYITGGKIGGNTDELAGTGTQGYGIQIDGNTHSNIRIIGTNVLGNATNSSEGILQSISSGTGNSIQYNAGSTVAIDT